MLEKPALEDATIIACLRNEFGLSIAQLSFLPLGADMNTAVYRAVTDDNTAYFVKLRNGDFNQAAVTVPNALSSLGMKQVIPPLTTQTGQLWASITPFTVILYPFVEGHHGFAKKLSTQQWVEFGAALQQFHTATIPSALTNGIPTDNFSPRWRNTLKVFLERIEYEAFHEPVAIALADFLKTKKDEMLELIQRTEQFAHLLRAHPPASVLCHADIHGWNLLIDTSGALYIVDWDTLIFAPKERDLMFIGGGLGNSGYTPQEEATMFYQGYGQTTIHHVALAYYRCERIIEDIAVYCEQIFLSDEGGADRNEALEHVKSNFLPTGTIAMAYQSANVQ